MGLSMKDVRVAVNGYGVIGKRVADAVKVQKDMTLVGVADVAHDYRVQTAVRLGIPVFATDEEAGDAMTARGIPVRGSLEQLLDDADVVVDCTPKKVAASNKVLYDRKGIKSVFQGG